MATIKQTSIIQNHLIHGSELINSAIQMQSCRLYNKHISRNSAIFILFPHKKCFFNYFEFFTVCGYSTIP